MIRKRRRTAKTRSARVSREAPEGLGYGLPPGEAPDIRITATPAAQDPNSLLMAGHSLISVFTKAAPAKLSFEGRCRRAAGLDGIAYEYEREAIAADFGLRRVSAVDKEVTKWRRLDAKPEEQEEEDEKVPDDPPWEGDVDFAAALDVIVAEGKRFIAAPAWYFDILALWGAASHLPHIDRLGVDVMPQLGVQSHKLEGENTGKSLVLELLATIAFRGQLRSSYSPATVFRSISAQAKTCCLVDIHNYPLQDPSELKQIVNACHKRAEAYVDRCEKLEDGSIVVRTYHCWAGLAWTSIGRLPREIESRAIILPMRRALAGEFAKLDKESTPGRSPKLHDVRRQLAAWSETLSCLPRVRPEYANRDFDNWRLLYQVAELAGGDWPQRVRAAAAALHKIEREPSVLVRLLRGIRTVFNALPPAAEGEKRIATPALIEQLRKDEEGGWDEVNGGRPITPWWLSRQLVGVIEPPGSIDWWVGAKGNQTHCSGYREGQFKDSFLRYLSECYAQFSETESISPYGSRGVTGVPGVPPSEAKDSAKIGTPVGRPGDDGSQSHRVYEATSGTPDPSSGPPVGSSERVYQNRIEINALDSGTPGTPVVADRDIDSNSSQNAPVSAAKPSDKALEIRGNGGTKPAREGRKTGAPELDISTPYAPPYRPGSIADAIRKLRQDHPNRSLKWIAHQVGQPKSVVEAVLNGLGPTGEAC